MPSRFSIALALVSSTAVPTLAQEPFPACETQQDVEQVLQSDGQLSPEGCWKLKVTRVQTQVGELCVLDFEPRDTGVLDTLREAAVPTQWWIECADLASR